MRVISFKKYSTYHGDRYDIPDFSQGLASRRAEMEDYGIVNIAIEITKCSIETKINGQYIQLSCYGSFCRFTTSTLFRWLFLKDHVERDLTFGIEQTSSNGIRRL